MPTKRGIQVSDDMWIKNETKHVKGKKLLEEFQSHSVNTIPKMFDYLASKFPNNSCMATRELFSRNEYLVNSVMHEKLKLGKYKISTYTQVLEKINAVAFSLTEFELEDSSMIAIFSETREECLISAIGCMKAGYIPIVFNSLNNNNYVNDIIDETNVSVIFTSYGMHSVLFQQLNEASKLTTVIIMDDDIEDIEDRYTINDQFKIMWFKELLRKNLAPVDFIDKSSPDMLSLIMYTSGTSGKPIGVKISHTNIFWSIIGYHYVSRMNCHDKYIAYLPLGHIMEFVTEMCVFAVGGAVYFSSPGTLTNKSCKIISGDTGDIVVAEPTCMNAVPLILDRLLNEVNVMVSNKGFIWKYLFDVAVYLKSSHYFKVLHPILNMLIFEKVKAVLGGKLKYLTVGGAIFPISTQKTIESIFDCKIQCGYGTTETTASAASQDYDDDRHGFAGPPNYKVKIKLENWEEGGYKITDKPRPRGEIIVGGPNISKGYFKNERKTNELFYEKDNTRWFRTGDIGEIDETGVLYLIDRKSDLVKLSNGEYVALGEIEAKLKRCVILESVCAVARPGVDFVIAIVVFNSQINDWVERKKIKVNLDDNLNENEKLKNMVLEEIKETCLSQGVNKFAIPQSIFICKEKWNVDNGRLTGSQKVIRTKILADFKEKIDHIYSL